MIVVVVLLLVVAVCDAKNAAPNHTDYQAIYDMEALNLIPWPLASSSGPLQTLNNSQLQLLGKQTWPHVPSSQNKTAMALVVYDWSEPDYRRPNFILTARGNITTLGALITYIPPYNGPYVGNIFGLNGTTTQEVLLQLSQQIARVNRWCYGEADILAYALNQMPAIKYKDTQAPATLYRGDGRDVTFFCNQFVATWGLSIDDCVSRVFGVGATFTVNPFWSTTPFESVIAHFTASVRYNILPNNKTRTAWHARSISNFSVDMSQDEFLYPANSQFVVVSKQCVKNPATFLPMWNITLMELGAKHLRFGEYEQIDAPPFQANFTTCVNM